MSFDFSTIQPAVTTREKSSDSEEFDFATIGPALDSTKDRLGGSDNPTPMALFDEALAREEQETDFTAEEINFLEQQEGKQQDPMKGIEDLLKLREGLGEESYTDSEGHLTGGIGHLMTEEEKELYPEGTPIPQDVRDKWFKEDVAGALQAAKEQAAQLPNVSTELLTALTSVNFQLGVNWNKIHEETWKLLTQGKWEEAAEEAANSTWYKQTKNRVEDFQTAIRGMKDEVESNNS